MSKQTKPSHPRPADQAATDTDGVLSANVGLVWQGQDCHFSDWRYIPAISPTRDRLPANIASRLAGAVAGDCLSQPFSPGELFPDQRKSRIRRLPVEQYQPAKAGLPALPPRRGRFYPACCFQPLAGFSGSEQAACRIVSVDDESLVVDFNHPLAGRNIEFKLCIDSLEVAASRPGNGSQHVASLVGDDGPGMQDSLARAATDFWNDEPFRRADEGDDSKAFEPTLTPFWDEVALRQVSRFYQRHLGHCANILDLMAGVHSPLQETTLAPARVSGAGLNPIELEHNPVYTERRALNVNDPRPLPFEDASFDAVLIHAAFEYAANPRTLVNEVARLLQPDGFLVISFSNRFVASKATAIWSQVEDFERTGLVLALLRESAAFGNFVACSQRGYARPSCDELARTHPYSDPVFILQARKKAPERGI